MVVVREQDGTSEDNAVELSVSCYPAEIHDHMVLVLDRPPISLTLFRTPMRAQYSSGSNPISAVPIVIPLGWYPTVIRTCSHTVPSQTLR
jgi:hypothetical protein